MFGFGKALDVLRDGDAVTRTNPPYNGFLRLAPKQESDTGDHVIGARFVWVIDNLLGTTYEEVWTPTHSDLLAEDWDYVR